ncbi:MAG: methyltransferase dimerization domain-containing protein [bacterium]
MKTNKIADRIPEVSLEPIERMARGHEISQILFTAIEYDIFTLLTEPKTAVQISKEIRTDLHLTEKFLNALVALQLLLKINDRYANTKISETFLVKESPFYQGNLLKLMANGYNTWSKLGNMLRGIGVQESEEKFEYIDKVFIFGHAEGAISGSLQKTVRTVAALSEFKNAKRLLDLGGGHGLYAIAFGQLNPSLDIFVFDLPHVTEITRNFIEQYGMKDRIKVIAGDFTKDDIRNGYDIIFASDVPIFGILKKIHSALNEGGVLIYRRWILNDDGTAPLVSVLFDLMLSIRRSDHHVCTLGEYIDWLGKANLSITRVIDIFTPSDPTKIIVAKKV